MKPFHIEIDEEGDVGRNGVRMDTHCDKERNLGCKQEHREKKPTHRAREREKHTEKSIERETQTERDALVYAESTDFQEVSLFFS